MKIPIIYRWVVDALGTQAYEKEIEVHRARRIISMRFKLNRRMTSSLIRELKELGLIEIQCKRIIKIL